MTNTTEDQIDEFLLTALHNPRDRLTLLKLDSELERFMRDQLATRMDFPPMSSYQRLIVHRVAQHFKLEHSVVDIDPQKRSVVLLKTPESKIPTVRFSEFCEKEVSQPKIKIMQRSEKPSPEKNTNIINNNEAAANNFTNNTNNPNNINSNNKTVISNSQRPTILSRAPTGKNTTGQQGSGLESSTGGSASPSPPTLTPAIRSLEEREIDYQKARARIFSSDTTSNSHKDSASSSSSNSSTSSPVPTKPSTTSISSSSPNSNSKIVSEEKWTASYLDEEDTSYSSNSPPSAAHDLPTPAAPSYSEQKYHFSISSPKSAKHSPTVSSWSTHSNPLYKGSSASRRGTEGGQDVSRGFDADEKTFEEPQLWIPRYHYVSPSSDRYIQPSIPINPSPSQSSYFPPLAWNSPLENNYGGVYYGGTELHTPQNVLWPHSGGANYIYVPSSSSQMLSFPIQKNDVESSHISQTRGNRSKKRIN